MGLARQEHDARIQPWERHTGQPAHTGRWFGGQRRSSRQRCQRQRQRDLYLACRSLCLKLRHSGYGERCHILCLFLWRLPFLTRHPLVRQHDHSLSTSVLSRTCRPARPCGGRGLTQTSSCVPPVEYISCTYRCDIFGQVLPWPAHPPCFAPITGRF